MKHCRSYGVNSPVPTATITRSSAPKISAMSVATGRSKSMVRSAGDERGCSSGAVFSAAQVQSQLIHDLATRRRGAQTIDTSRLGLQSRSVGPCVVGTGDIAICGMGRLIIGGTNCSRDRNVPVSCEQEIGPLTAVGEPRMEPCRRLPPLPQEKDHEPRQSK